jgi:hypothetical protein
VPSPVSSTAATPAETLRAAATLMRERATAATPGPWRPVAGLWKTETFAAVIGPKGVAENAETWLMATGRGAVSQEADADHAASWHPGVALAVADWLGIEAAALERGLPDKSGTKHAALRIARAFLGEREGEAP